MKKLVFILFIIILASCGGKDAENTANSYADMTISMDTVVVDSGNEILMAATQSYSHNINDKVDRLYFWDIQSYNLEVVDLDEMVLLEKMPYEKEGPNGVGQYPYQMMLIGDDKVAFVEWNQIVIADMNGNLIKKVKMDEEWMKEGLGEKESLNPLGFSDDGNTLYCTISNFERLNSDIIQVDLENKTTKLIELPEYDKRENFRVTFKSEEGGGMSMSMTYPSLSLDRHQDKLIFWSNAFNALYEYDPEADSLSYRTITNTLTPNEKSGTYQNDVSTLEAMSEVRLQIAQEVSFSKLFWDDQNKVFYRFAHYNLPKIADEAVKSKVFISILNNDFEVIGEKEVTEIFKSVPTAQFVKDGKIHAFLNVDDELAYIRMEIN
ncbi:hypothetical protein Belba_1139 [Belliella baltica DSM 15883]|uniref:DUF4221 domain-containing protein n=1 Tax=Belliella baltica (strain DSM 15883 / CIP 108006 / LMG 21964 / BA134) TaxID=866536 RepID=I3Z3F7_BELBD|nr:DUF4221 family protein [Belliella baltica]AFL83775.1 hypothetical protein Belba_1139 [Belliella baltica DSM 15883]